MITTSSLLQADRHKARVAAKVPRWLKEVPLYRQRSARGPCRERSADFWRCFQTLPIITKNEIRREFPHNFLPPNLSLEDLIDAGIIELERTSGTAEEPTPLLLERGWWDEQEQRALRLNQFVDRLLTTDTRRVTLNSPMCSHDICYQGTPSPADRVLRQTLFVNLNRHPFLWSDAALERMAEETLAWDPVFLDVDPVYGALFARYCEQQQIRLPSLKFILSSYEFLSTVHRRILQRVFQVPVFNLYGSTETGHLLMEDEQGHLTPSLRTAYLEVLREDANGVGELIVTTLTNQFMPLIRYGIGDLVQVTADPYQTVFRLHGRAQDALTDTEGRRVTVEQVDQCLAAVDGLAHYQLAQVSADRYRLRYATEHPEVNEAALLTVRQRMEDLLGTRRGLEFEKVESFLAENSGKFRLAVPWNPPRRGGD